MVGFMVMGALAGVLGALYNYNAAKLFTIRPKRKHWQVCNLFQRTPVSFVAAPLIAASLIAASLIAAPLIAAPLIEGVQVAEVATISLVTSIVTLLMAGLAGQCREMPKMPVVGVNSTHWETYEWAVDMSLGGGDCETGEFNDMALLWFSNRELALKAVIEEPSAFSWHTLLLMGVVFFVLQSWTFGTSITSGNM